MTRLPHLLAISLFITSALAKSRHRQVTVEIAAGAVDCFYLPDIKSGQTIDLEYQVTSSSAATGKNDVTVRVFSPVPTATQLFENKMEGDGGYNGEAEEDGDYKFCLDNSMSTWSDKIVWFEVSVEDPDDDYDDDYIDAEDWETLKENNEDTQTLFDMKMEDIKTSVHDVRIHIGKIRHYQFMVGAHMSKDTHQVEANLSRLNFWSVVHMTLMIVVGLVQVFVVRQLFEDKSVVHKMISKT